MQQHNNTTRGAVQMFNVVGSMNGGQVVFNDWPSIVTYNGLLPGDVFQYEGAFHRVVEEGNGRKRMWKITADQLAEYEDYLSDMDQYRQGRG